MLYTVHSTFKWPWQFMESPKKAFQIYIEYDRIFLHLNHWNVFSVNLTSERQWGKDVGKMFT